MENTPEAAGAAQAPQTEAKPIINSTPAPAQVQTSAPAAPDMHGFTSDQLADMKKFFDSQGGYEKVKSRISNPQNYSEPVQKPNLDATYAMKKEEGMLKAPQPETPKYQAPEGSITREEFLAQQYFHSLAKEEKYAAIAGDVESGALLKDMAAFNIRPINPDGSINDTMVRRYLDLKAQTVTAKQTSATPEASAAPTVDYMQFDEANMDIRKATAILQQDSALRAKGLGGNPDAQKAEEFMKKILNKKQ